MQNHYLLSDDVFETQFEDCSLNPKLFSHEAHIRLAWIHIKKYGVDRAITNINSQLLNFVVSVRARDKYNKTVTVAAVKTVYHFMLKSNTDNFKSFILEFPRLNKNFKALLNSHYSMDLFNYEAAKKQYIEPDVLPYD
jgi:hypothetical protein